MLSLHIFSSLTLSHNSFTPYLPPTWSHINYSLLGARISKLSSRSKKWNLFSPDQASIAANLIKSLASFLRYNFGLTILLFPKCLSSRGTNFFLMPATRLYSLRSCLTCKANKITLPKVEQILSMQNLQLKVKK